MRGRRDRPRRKHWGRENEKETLGVGKMRRMHWELGQYEKSTEGVERTKMKP